MKISEFAEKYGISVTIVREASFETDEGQRREMYHSKDIPEDKLFEAVKANIEKKLKNAQDSVEKNQRRLDRLIAGRI